jgi:putative Mn2+ efflux pump MntP
MNIVALVSAFTAALLHTLIPSHWLCFVAVGKAQKWPIPKTLLVAGAAGTLHVLSTVALGILLIVVGTRFIDVETLEKIAGFVLIGMGAVYLGLQVFHVGHHHENDAVIPQKVAIVTLLLSVTLSPCSLAIPVLVASAGNWTMILVLGIVLLVTTVGNMLLLVGLTSLGIEKLKFAFFERHEKWIVGIVLIILGTAILVFHQ